ncbi:hypothetical protein DMH04_20830 [Kibdelosporangium aridum]|uniref:Uncharacterized protein n=1 Tax=Kibdelosporangium aridum TaxID=2030 RepID=A0A428Z931_KIBAR|nr:hypothetical protein [Kibdelosporangium aridum]RSM84562.1 hypothetical protein DMH04_20830 [Kibdelosporangium aridum]
MDELEQRLRSALTEMAEEVPPSHGAWEDQQRRLALKSRRDRRRPAVMAAVAAAVVALIALPVVLITQQWKPVDPAGSLPVASSPQEQTQSPAPPSVTAGRGGPEYISVAGESLVTPPIATSSQFTGKDRASLVTYAYTVRTPTGYWQLCKAQNYDGEAINGPQQSTFGSPTCQNVVRPLDSKQYLWGRRDLSTPDNPGVWAFVMSHPADRVWLRRPDGALATSFSKSVGNDFVLFVVYMNTPGAPTAWTVFDGAHNVLQHGS